MKFSKKKKLNDIEKKLPFIAKFNLTKLEEERLASFNPYNADKSILSHCFIPRIRLVYAGLEKFDSSLGKKIGLTVAGSSVFLAPTGLRKNDIYKIISYICTKIEKDFNLEPASKKSFIKTCEALEKFGFKKTDDCKEFKAHSLITPTPFYKIKTEIEELPYCTDLITYNENVRGLFKKTDLSARYFDWFVEGITLEDAKNTYYSHGLMVPQVLNTEQEKE